jgi:hypothetical protein
MPPLNRYQRVRGQCTAIITFNILTSILCACQPLPNTHHVGTYTPSSPSPTTTQTPIKLSTPTPAIPSPIAELLRPTRTQIPTDIPDSEPAGCKTPLEDYSRLQINGHSLNKRTVDMLEHAALLYNGKINITNTAITQGSYSDNGPASFGTHLGGGAVDLSVLWYDGTRLLILESEIEPLILALRTAGFAAWLREVDEAYPGTGIHIHAIAIGDQELSYSAQQQLTGDFGYFRGYNGLPQPYNHPQPDRHTGPILCDWMKKLGYSDLRLQPESDQAPIDVQYN